MAIATAGSTPDSRVASTPLYGMSVKSVCVSTACL